MSKNIICTTFVNNFFNFMVGPMKCLSNYKKLLPLDEIPKGCTTNKIVLFFPPSYLTSAIYSLISRRSVLFQPVW